MRAKIFSLGKQRSLPVSTALRPPPSPSPSPSPCPTTISASANQSLCDQCMRSCAGCVCICRHDLVFSRDIRPCSCCQPTNCRQPLDTLLSLPFSLLPRLPSPAREIREQFFGLCIEAKMVKELIGLLLFHLALAFHLLVLLAFHLALDHESIGSKSNGRAQEARVGAAVSRGFASKHVSGVRSEDVARPLDPRCACNWTVPDSLRTDESRQQRGP